MFNKTQLNQLYRYALALSQSEEMAYDLVQAAIERFLLKDVSEIEKPFAFIKIIIRNLYFDIQRHNKVIPIVSLDDDDITYIEPFDDGLMESALINQQEIQILLASLSAEENELLYLWAVEEHTVEEIAALYQKPKGTMLSKLHRLKKRIRNQFNVRRVSANEE